MRVLFELMKVNKIGHASSVIMPYRGIERKAFARGPVAFTCS